jgi:hypothetical protein
MKRIAILNCWILVSCVAFASIPHGLRPSPIQPFDVYDNICWENEKSRLDNFAIQLQNQPNVKGYIVVYAGKESCAAEAQTRALRAKKWLVERRGISAARVLWKNGGYRENVETKLWIWPEGAGDFPADPTLLPSAVKVVRACKGRILRPMKCK